MADFGVIIGCCRRDYGFAKGTVASVRHYMPDMPICLLVDGDFPTDDMQRAYRYGYGVLDENLNFVADPGEKKIYFEVGGYGNYLFFENPR